MIGKYTYSLVVSLSFDILLRNASLVSLEIIKFCFIKPNLVSIIKSQKFIQGGNKSYFLLNLIFFLFSRF